ncbi:protein FAR1-RELATED SEQUENCE 5 [Medicago truncatula]|uniref:protein FAR1-RELATED SEQUENCE 5 n=1 Tax=Medicago truncatula TaxID=3880 RepID=UPI0019672B60|nr:protein FAR1-RELATED SEQUENCE 5-like [Medicago truncatula]
MENFQAEPSNELVSDAPEGFDNGSGSGSDIGNISSGDEDVGESNNEGFPCNHDVATAVDCMVDVRKINLKEMSCEEIMRYHFLDREVAFMFYNWYACLHGFAGRRSRNVRNVNGQIVQQTFLCHREGIRDDRYNKTVIRKGEHKPTSRCGCQAKFQVHIDFKSDRWYIKYFDDVHNHSFLDSKYEGMLPVHRTMTNHDKFQMKTMRKSGIPTSRIYGYFATQAGGYEKLDFTKRDMYNEQLKERGSKSSDADAALEFLKGMCTRDDMMFWKHTLNVDGSLKHLFWCDGESRMDYSLFGDVLAFDATYRKIKYNTPLVIFSGVNHHNKSVIFGSAIVGEETEDSYVWLLENFLEAMDGKCLVSVITDGDLSMRNAIGRVFPDAHHRLCAWHLIRNATSNVKNLQFVVKFKRCMLDDIDVDEFDRRWEELLHEFGLYGNRWMLEMYEKRDKWATAHIRGKFYAGFWTTSRCEGLHSEFGKYVNVLSNFVDFLNQFFRWLNHLRYKEMQMDYVTSFGDTVLQTPHKCLERSVANLYTRSVFHMFRPMLERAVVARLSQGVIVVQS